MRGMTLVSNGVAEYRAFTTNDSFIADIGSDVLASSSDNKKEDKMNPDVFADLKTVFGIGEDFDDAADFYKKLHYAAEGIRQQDGLERVTGAFAFSDAVLDRLGSPVPWDDEDPEEQVGYFAGKTTTIIGGNEEEQ